MKDITGTVVVTEEAVGELRILLAACDPHYVLMIGQHDPQHTFGPWLRVLFSRTICGKGLALRYAAKMHRAVRSLHEGGYELEDMSTWLRGLDTAPRKSTVAGKWMPAASASDARKP